MTDLKRDLAVVKWMVVGLYVIALLAGALLLRMAAKMGAL